MIQSVFGSCFSFSVMARDVVCWLADVSENLNDAVYKATALNRHLAPYLCSYVMSLCSR